jgi:hypothetical protein
MLPPFLPRREDSGAIPRTENQLVIFLLRLPVFNDRSESRLAAARPVTSAG